MARPMQEHPGITRRVRITVAAVAAVSVVLTVVALYVVWLGSTISLRTTELSRQVYAIAQGMASAGEVDLETAPALTGLRAQLFEVEGRLLDARLALVDDEGAVVYPPPAGGTAATYDVERLTGEPDVRGIRTGVKGVSGAGQVIVVAAPVGGGYLVAVQPLREAAPVLRTGAVIGAVAALLAIAGAWLAGGVAARRVTAPLVRLRDAAEAIAEGSWGRQVTVEGDAEVRALARSFNAMSARVHAAYSAQKEFVGNVSHELRTPITSIQGYAGALLDGMADTDEKRERFARIIRDEAGRLMELTSTLLALADLDSGRIAVARTAIDTTGLAEVLRARHESAAQALGVALRVDDLAGPAPCGDADRLLQVASALISNALAYTPAGGEVRVSAGVHGDRWTLVVDDSGPGIPEFERDRVFDRFARLDPSRASATGGFGLGLAICKRLTEAMGGSISAEESPLGGARLVVTLALADAPATEAPSGS